MQVQINPGGAVSKGVELFQQIWRDQKFPDFLCSYTISKGVHNSFFAFKTDWAVPLNTQFPWLQKRIYRQYLLCHKQQKQQASSRPFQFPYSSLKRIFLIVRNCRTLGMLDQNQNFLYLNCSTPVDLLDFCWLKLIYFLGPPKHPKGAIDSISPSSDLAFDCPNNLLPSILPPLLVSRLLSSGSIAANPCHLSVQIPLFSHFQPAN